MKPKLTPVAQLGDLITIDGYGARLFRVDSYTHEIIYERGAEYEDIYYDCTCVTSSEYTLGAQDDVTVVSESANAKTFLKTYKHPEIKPFDFTNMFDKLIEGAKVVKQPIKATPVAKVEKRLTKKEQIDALLDERNVVGEFLFEDVGDIDAYKAERYAEIDAKITALLVE